MFRITAKPSDRRYHGKTARRSAFYRRKRIERYLNRAVNRAVNRLFAASPDIYQQYEQAWRDMLITGTGWLSVPAQDVNLADGASFFDPVAQK
jgi:hypothetical protein